MAFSQFNDGILRTKDLSVRNLPFNKEMQEKVRTRLSNISGNCGGRVSFIQRDYTTGSAWCIISFPSADDANRYVIFHRLFALVRTFKAKIFNAFVEKFIQNASKNIGGGSCYYWKMHGFCCRGVVLFNSVNKLRISL